MLDGEGLSRDPRAFAARLFAAGVDWIQLRDRKLEAAVLLRITRSLVAARDAAQKTSAADGPLQAGDARALRVIVNKRADVALAAGADGVHLGLDALDPLTLDALAPGALRIGASLHSIAELEARLAAAEPLACVHLAPIWPPRSKPAERPALGLEVLARAARIAAGAGVPLLAQGGLDAGRAAAAVAAGAAGIAVTGDLGGAGDPAAAARVLRRALDAQAAATGTSAAERGERARS
ncbi:MAG: thiamine phosphate synthase [Myxococcota bacterium]